MNSKLSFFSKIAAFLNPYFNLPNTGPGPFRNFDPKVDEYIGNKSGPGVHLGAPCKGEIQCIINPDWSQQKFLYTSQGINPEISVNFEVGENGQQGVFLLDVDKEKLCGDLLLFKRLACSCRVPLFNMAMDQQPQSTINLSATVGQSHFAAGGGVDFNAKEDLHSNSVDKRFQNVQLGGYSFGALLHGTIPPKENRVNPEKPEADDITWLTSLIFSVGREQNAFNSVGRDQGVQQALVEEQPKQTRNQNKKLTKNQKKKLKKKLKKQLKKQKKQKNEELVESVKEAKLKWLTFTLVGEGERWKFAASYTKFLFSEVEKKDLYSVGLQFKKNDYTNVTLEFDDNFVLKVSCEQDFEVLVWMMSCLYDYHRNSVGVAFKLCPGMEKRGSEGEKRKAPRLVVKGGSGRKGGSEAEKGKAAPLVVKGGSEGEQGKGAAATC